MSRLYVLDGLHPRLAVERLLAVAVHLPEHHAVAPHVAGVAEGPEVDALGGVPLNRPTTSRLRPITGVYIFPKLYLTPPPGALFPTKVQ